MTHATVTARRTAAARRRNTPARRAARRDYWTSPRAALTARALEWLTAIAGTATALTIGSLNF
jgi:hypothetical protein